MSNQQRKTRYIYDYNNEKYEVPDHFVYQIHGSKGGGYDINEAFFTWAFNKHGISIVDIQVIYANTDRTPKGDKNTHAASSTFYIATVKGRDKRQIEKVGDGESGNESITNFQRGYPAGLAIKRAKVNMGKEFFNLVDLKMATDSRDFTLEFGNDKGKTLEDLARTPQGMGTVQWLASDKFTGDGLLKLKAQEFLHLYANGPAPKTDYSIGRATKDPMPIPQQGNSAPSSNPNQPPVQPTQQVPQGQQPPQGGNRPPQGQPPQQGGYGGQQGQQVPQGQPPQQGNFNPNQGQPNAPQGNFNPNQGQQPMPQGQPPQQGGYANPPQGQPPQQGNFNPNQGPAPQGNFQQPPQGQGYGNPPQGQMQPQGNFNPNQGQQPMQQGNFQQPQGQGSYNPPPR